jgi:hypothetical protein
MSPLPEIVEAIDREIAELQARLPLVEGSPCEVYDRICGYFRPLDRWNDGMRQNQRERVRFYGNINI